MNIAFIEHSEHYVQVTIAARISHGSAANDVWNACAVPSKTRMDGRQAILSAVWLPQFLSPHR